MGLKGNETMFATSYLLHSANLYFLSFKEIIENYGKWEPGFNLLGQIYFISFC